MIFSIEAEQAVCGGLLVDPEKLTEVLELINYQDFYSARCRHVFYAIHTLAAANHEIDAITVTESLTAAGTIDEAGGFAFVVQLASEVASTANILAYAKIIGEKSLQRKLIKSCSEIIQATESGAHSTQELLAFATEQMSILDGGVNSEPIQTFQQLLKSRVRALDDRRNGGAVQGMLTGFKALDERFNGIGPGMLWVLGARPGMGKTTLALNIVENVASDGGEVLIFTIEMVESELADKIICSASKLPYQALRSGQLNESQWSQLEIGVGRLLKKNIHIIDKPGLDVAHAMNIAKKFAKSGNLKLIVVDYLQLLKCKSASRFDEVSEVSRQLKIMAKLCGCPVLALSQLSRKCEERLNKRPNNSDLRESGQIEQDADIITFIYRDEVYNPDTRHNGIAELITSKWRFGDMGTDGVGAELAQSRFCDLDYKFTQYDPDAEQKPAPRAARGWQS